jgi:ferredoxin
MQSDRGESPFHYSLAKGGLSSVWGASLLPVHPDDIRDWPFPYEDLVPHYQAIFDWLPTAAGAPDGLEEILPSYSQKPEPLRFSQQIESFVQDLEKGRPKDIRFGRSRQAVFTGGRSGGPGCAYCGRCLYGCPYGLIFSTADALDDLRRSGRIDYIDRQRVERLEQAGDSVRVYTTDLGTGEPALFEAGRVFVGTGILPTAWLVLRSRDAIGKKIVMKDSQYFIYPFLRWPMTRGVQEEPLHTLSQLYMEIRDPKISKHLVHLEVFSFSDYLKRALLQTPLRFFLGIPWVAEQFFGRMLIIQGFLHSEDSRTFSVELRAGDNGRPRLHLEANRSGPGFSQSVKTGLKLLSQAHKLRGIPILPALQFAAPGRSYHSGGGFPMRKNPTDLLMPRHFPAFPPRRWASTSWQTPTASGQPPQGCDRPHCHHRRPRLPRLVARTPFPRRGLHGECLASRRGIRLTLRARRRSEGPRLDRGRRGRPLRL